MARLDEETCCFYEDVCTGSVQETHGARSPIFSLPMWYRETWGLLANSLLFPIPLKKLGARRFIFNIPCVLSRWRKLIEATLQGRSSICVPLRSIYCSAKRTIWKLFSEVSVKYQDLKFTFKFFAISGSPFSNCSDLFRFARERQSDLKRASIAFS